MDRVQTKDKARPTEGLTVLGPLAEICAKAREERRVDPEDASLRYGRRDFTAAVLRLENCLRVEPAGRLAASDLTRGRQCLVHAPAEGWNAVQRMTRK